MLTAETIANQLTADAVDAAWRSGYNLGLSKASASTFAWGMLTGGAVVIFFHWLFQLLIS